MSRVSEGDFDECYPNQSQLQWANAERCLKGKRGQQALLDLEAALLAMPVKELLAGNLARAGQVCTLGAFVVAKKIGEGMTYAEAVAELELAVKDFDEESDGTDIAEITVQRAKASGFPSPIAYEVLWQTDYHIASECSPARRWELMLKWVRTQIIPVAA